jgi:RHH-type proline utilization regulon transcriptional repressor/proline dehydrogenase/delta 1-pyrroline-5-carboxylate dehydrogenase
VTGEAHQSIRHFADFASAGPPQSGLRAAITAATRRPEPECVTGLIAAATLAPGEAAQAARIATRLVTRLREKIRGEGIEALIHEYSLSSQEGIALMCLAEALLRIPDAPTRDRLIRDKIANGDWQAHLGHSPSPFVNAATWGLVITGRLTASASETGLASALTRLIAHGGEPLIRAGTDLAMRMLGEHFVSGRTIEEALANSRRMEARGYRYSYDMLGEAAVTAADAARYLAAYEDAIHAIGRHADGRGPCEGPGISIKLSALHPRYGRMQRRRVLTELAPRMKHLAALARRYDLGLNIDAEESDRLDLSLDILESLALDRDLAGWSGLGFVVQAYGKRAPFVIDWLIDLARRTGRRLMVRLVKGAYWDAEIKRAQIDGLADFPVFTHKVHTDVCYLACARRLLDARAFVFPQFATHNAQTLASVLVMAGPDFSPANYEFQCLHGMGEPLYDEVVGTKGLARPCRIYAPVGTHETLLAYLVRRLLENGANSSFVHRIADPDVPIGALIRDPVVEARAIVPLGAPHPRIRLPPALFADRKNSAGIDLSNEQDLARLAASLGDSATIDWRASSGDADEGFIAVTNPADAADIVGYVRHARAENIEAALAAAATATPRWVATPVAERAGCLTRAADMMQARMEILAGLIIREAGKTCADAIGEIREAVDFLRYYAAEALRILDADSAPLGPVVAISPWNFPLSIFTGQVAAALVAGNPVLAKPAEETPLVAAEAVRLLLAAGVPPDVLHLLPGEGNVGAALVGDPRVQGVVFTGSTEVARAIRRQLAQRLAPDGTPVTLIAETGGQNAMIVDSSALAEQVVGDVIASAFTSAGQRCSALRILCLQDDIADGLLAMLKGALRELSIGNPEALSIDVGPVISAEARDRILRHVVTMRGRGHRVDSLPLSAQTHSGTFFAPTIIEIDRIPDVEHEVFGPVLHVLRYRRDELGRLIADINATGYALTFGLHTRIDETIAQARDSIDAGNVYVNRTMIGAVVGVQPFGGSGLSGTGPKAGGPLYLARLVRRPPPRALDFLHDASPDAGARAFASWLRDCGHADAGRRCESYLRRSRTGATMDCPGPVGEHNIYALRARGRTAALARDGDAMFIQIGAVLATGNVAVVERGAFSTWLDGIAAVLGARIVVVARWQDEPALRGILFQGDDESLLALQRQIAAREGALLSLQAVRSPQDDYALEWLVEESSVSVNTTAAGGNASLLALA